MQQRLRPGAPCMSSGTGGQAAARPGPRAASRRRAVAAAASSAKEVTLLDYGAGNIRSVRNAIKRLGYTIKDVEKPSDIAAASRLVFPGVGAFGQAMGILKERDLVKPLVDYIHGGKPFFGICLGLQLLFDGSDESGGHEGLGVIPGRVAHFGPGLGLPVPHIGWNTLEQRRGSALLGGVGAGERVYFVHSYRAMPTPANEDWVLSTTSYGEDFVSAVLKGNAMACQFHPEKSGATGLRILRSFLDPQPASDGARAAASDGSRGLAKRVIACLDVRSNDTGDLVVTKGDQYDVREKEGEREVRNLGKPVDLAARYFEEGADEVAFLNITGFRDCPLSDLPMLGAASERVFVPMTVGGGIRAFASGGRQYSALEGFDLHLVDAVSKAVNIPVIASSGAGAPKHFTEVFQSTGAAAALAAGIFHRREVGIDQVKRHMEDNGVPARL
ncbi:imidazole glycerol phosphate synthase, chloroplastic [Raphidocelis subcapitata]|uniref:Imidazole glycerol phosphate synthase, chloroplastic n=1 Tax=Raphidocelis subcapitata TaxID=307507 RepID=A0A2V0NRC0_9CHLO|nr:imidazole glycerol phosphate synthase, chloroplastic [Raphidocelis subcapitata]|eukprot:GBF88110.1 imidazole glycerol phosphate synthase, chloroplastic [Raphidocelis subcapitata]